MISINDAVQIALDAAGNASLWESIVINKRKPHTYRAFIHHEDSRICLHRFEPCEPEDSFAHPHPWPSSMLILSGQYEMAVGHTSDLDSRDPKDVIDLTLGAGSIYKMDDRHTWHQVIPRSRCYSLMVNGPRWENAHRFAPSTSGKGLESMTAEELANHLNECTRLLQKYADSL